MGGVSTSARQSRCHSLKSSLRTSTPAATVHPALGPCFPLIFLSVCAPAQEALRSPPQSFLRSPGRPPSAGCVIGMTISRRIVRSVRKERARKYQRSRLADGASKASFYLCSRHSLSILLQLAVHPAIPLVGDKQHDDVTLVEAK